MRPFYPLILFSCSFSLLCAQEIVQMESIEVQGEISTMEERRDNSIAKRIITSEELSRYGDMNVQEMLKRVPGVTIAEGKGKKGAPGKGYTKILIDGEEMLGSRRANPLEQLSPDMIERLEVMTNGSAEHSAESMGGIVNIVLKKPLSDGKILTKAGVGMYHDEPQSNLFAQYEGKKEKLSYVLNAMFNAGSKDDYATTSNDSYDEQTNSTSEQYNLAANAKLIYSPSAKDKYFLDLSLQTMEETKKSLQERSGGVTNTIHQRDEGDGWMYFAKLSGLHNLSSTDLIEWKGVAHASYSDGRANSIDSNSTSDQTDTTEFSVMGGEVIYSKAYNEHFIKMGSELKFLSQESIVDTTQNGTPQSHTLQSLDETKTSLFLQDEMSVGESMVFTPGLRYEASNRRIDGDEIKLDYFAPSLHGLYKLSDQDNLRASISKTVKLPRLDELTEVVDTSLNENDINHPDKTGNPSLKEESALSYELRYEHFFEDKGIVSFGGFYRTIEDKIEKLTTLESGRYVERPQNAGTGRVWSLEFELKKPLESLLKGLGVFTNASIQKTSLESGGEKRTIKGTPGYLYTVGIDHNIREYRLTYGASYRYVGGYDDPIDASGIAERQEGYGTLDLYAAKRLNESYKLGINLKNLTRDTIETTTQRYVSGVLDETQHDREHTRFHFLITLEGRF